MTVRPAYSAGSAYPGTAKALHDILTRMMIEVQAVYQKDPDKITPKAFIVPHAIYRYSGLTAAAAYVRLRNIAEQINRVVLVGPAHRVNFTGLAAPKATAFATPLGNIPLDTAALVQLVERFPQVNYLDRAHELEHSLEFQLPFLRFLFSDFQLIPLTISKSTPDEVAEVLDFLWGGPETLVLISSDLSHFHDYETTLEIDRASCHAIQTHQTERIGHEAACGYRGVRGYLELAKQRGLTTTLLNLGNYGDVTKHDDQIVGYASFMAEEEFWLSLPHQRLLGEIAKATIQQGANQPAPPEQLPIMLPPRLVAPRNSTVTLYHAEQVRGQATTTNMPLALGIAYAAWQAAYANPDSSPVTDLSELTLRCTIGSVEIDAGLFGS